MPLYMGDEKSKLYLGEHKPMHLYYGKHKITGYHEAAQAGQGTAEISDTYDDVVGGHVMGDARLVPPDCKYAEYVGTSALALTNTADKPIKGVRVRGKTVRGRNLFDPALWEVGKVWMANVGTPIEIAVNPQFVSYSNFTVSADTQYTVMINTETYRIERLAEVDDDGICTRLYTFADWESTNIWKITTQSTTNAIAIRLNRVDGADMTADDIDNLQFMVAQGAETTYEPYTELYSVTNPAVQVADPGGQSQTITLPYVLRGNDDVYDSVDTMLMQHIQRVAEDGTTLETPVVTNIAGDYSLVSYAGTTNITASDDNGMEVDFSAVAATAEIPEVPDPLNRFGLQCVDHPAVTSRGRNLFDKSKIDEAYKIAQTDTGIITTGSYATASGIYADEIFAPNTKYYTHADKTASAPWPKSSGAALVLGAGGFLIIGYAERADYEFTTPEVIPHEQIYFYGILEETVEFANLYIGTEPYVAYEPYHAASVTYPAELYALRDKTGATAAQDRLGLDGAVERECRYIEKIQRGGIYKRIDHVIRIGAYVPNSDDFPQGVKGSPMLSNGFRYSGVDLADWYMDAETIFWHSNTTRNYYFSIKKSTLNVQDSDTNEFILSQCSRFLELFPICAVYQLETPITEQLDTPELPSHYPTTVVDVTDSNGNRPDLTITARQHD